MTRFLCALAAFSCLATPTMAQDYLTRSTVPSQKMISVIPIPGSDRKVIKYTTTECGPPERLLGKHRDVLGTLQFNQPIRVIEPNMAVTQDFNPNRINFLVDDRGIIRGINCG